MKLIIQIPAFNEEATIAQTLRDLPKRLDGITSIETLVIDDGSSDSTAEAARKAGATHVIQLKTHRGLAAAFIAGIDAALRLGADVIVNTDADNQYQGADIAKLVSPIVRGTAEVVIGDRQVATSPHMSGFKRLLQRLGSKTVGLASGINVGDVTSGFRAFSREAAIQLNVFNPFTYTLETIIQAGNRNLGVQTVAINTNAPTRPSRLYSGIGTYLRKSMVTIFRVYALYRPLKTFFAIGSLLMFGGFALGLRFIYYNYMAGDRGGHIQSLILAAVLLIAGFHTWLIALLADLTAVNRRLSEEMLIRLKRLEMPEATPVAKPVQRAARPERTARPEQTARPARPERIERPARDEKRERPARSAAKADPPAAPAIPAAAAAAPASTQWVWLLDEDKLQDRIGGNDKPARETAPKAQPQQQLPLTPVREADLDDEEDDELTPEDAAATPAGEKRPGGPGRRRRRRRGGPRQSTDLPGNRGKHLGGEGGEGE